MPPVNPSDTVIGHWGPHMKHWIQRSIWWQERPQQPIKDELSFLTPRKEGFIDSNVLLLFWFRLNKEHHPGIQAQYLSYKNVTALIHITSWILLLMHCSIIPIFNADFLFIPVMLLYLISAYGWAKSSFLSHFVAQNVHMHMQVKLKLELQCAVWSDYCPSPAQKHRSWIVLWTTACPTPLP